MKQKILSVILSSLSGISILAAAILGSIAVPLSYEVDAHYFATDAALPILAAILAIVGALCGIAFSILLPKEQLSGSPFFGCFWYALPGVVGAIVAGVLLLRNPENTLITPVAVLLFLSAVYILCAELFHTFPALSDFTPYPGFAAVIGCALLNAYYYFDTSVEMNAPFKVLLQTALLFSMLYFTGEIRFLLNRAHPKLYLSLAVLTLATALPTSIMTITAYSLGSITRLDYLAGAILVLGYAITVILRVIHLLYIRAKEPIDENATEKLQEKEKEDVPFTPSNDGTENTEGETE